MPFSSFLNHATKRLRRGMVFTLICFLSLALLSACAESSDAEARADDASRTSGSTPTVGDAKEPAAKGAETSAPAESSETGDRAEETEQGQAGGSASGTALAMLSELEVKGRAPKTGYDSEPFKWRSDADHNGCDTRIICTAQGV